MSGGEDRPGEDFDILRPGLWPLIAGAESGAEFRTVIEKR